MNNHYLWNPVDNIYEFYFDGELLFSTTEPAIAFDQECYVLHKHGDSVKIFDWYSKSKAIFLQAGIHISVIASAKWDLEELNRCINSSGYTKTFIKNNNL